MNKTVKTFEQNEFDFWMPPEGMTLTIGEDAEIDVPQIPLPIHLKDMEEGKQPSERAIGEGLNTYLRSFPDCPHAPDYARILKEAYPFHVSDLGSEIIILDVKEVEPEFVREKINMLKVLALMEPENFGVLQNIGMAYYELAMVYSELGDVRQLMGQARLWLEKARRVCNDDLQNLNYLAQICYFSGGYPQAKLYWRIISDALEEGEAKDELRSRIDRIESEDLPGQPLLDRLEQVGVAMSCYSNEKYADACAIMEEVAADGRLPQELPNAEFFYFLGLCRKQDGRQDDAAQAFARTLEIDPQHKAAQDEIAAKEA
ncbi:hypothetical protein SAMN02745165_02975 [Malonomonas rubra DSM 5091]|uniref:Uncharacterized protein n=1 Tax=Malonomonas rubra DSM 5091 TaxID=1122189 RepID=A0A1M6LH58_MALRU|nr:tetratricopeptide repeat protein [Malonomonas rubra]SHJ70435.1 hypothetical protein SAMN02745165_02975 [Malonomonas rubra DSM 5091]